MEKSFFNKNIRYINITTFIAVICSSCFNTLNEIPIDFVLSESSIQFTSEGGEQAIIISTNTNNWTISNDADSWLAISPANGTKNGEIKVTASSLRSSSLSRSAILTIEGSGIEKKIINVTQSGNPTLFDDDVIAEDSFGGGEGTQNNPYLIMNAKQLKRLVDRVTSASFKLMTDIEVITDEWVPIGIIQDDLLFPFTGNFDGNGHTISGSLKSSNYYNFGFFGVIGAGAQISNLTITASIINEGVFTSTTENLIANTGAIAGKSIGGCIINDCYINGSVKSGIAVTSNTGGVVGNSDYMYYAGFPYDNLQVTKISNCDINGSIIGEVANVSKVGGVIGAALTGFIQNCNVSKNTITGGNVDNGFTYTGGIVGFISNGEISDCTVLSTVKIIGGECDNPTYLSLDNNCTGGIAGYNNVAITNCTNHAIVSGVIKSGGIVGENFWYGKIHACLNTGNISGSNITGGLVGHNNNGYVYPCCTNEGAVNGEPAQTSNQVGAGTAVMPICWDDHAKR